MFNMKRFILFALALWAALGFAGASHAAPDRSTITFLWSSVNDAAIAPTADLAIEKGSSATLDILVNADLAGVTAASVSATFDPAILSTEFGSVTVCPNGGVCGDPANGPTLSPIGVPTVDPGFVSVLSAVAPFPGAAPGQVDTTFLLAQIEFSAVAAGTSEVSPFFVPGLDGIGTGDFEFIIPEATGVRVTVEDTAAPVPEPSSAIVMGIGLALVSRQIRARNKRQVH